MSMNALKTSKRTSVNGAARPGFTIPAMVLLGILGGFGSIALDFSLPALPDLAESLGTSPAMAQLTLSMCLVGLAVGHLISGPLSDRIGRIRPLLVGVAVLAVTSVLCALAPNIYWLLPLRLIQGLAAATAIVIANAMVRDVHAGAPAARVFSQLILVTGMLPILGPIAGGQVLRFTDWRGVFLITGGLTIVIMLVARLVLHETHPTSARSTDALRDQWRSLYQLMTDRGFLPFFLLLGMHGTVMFTWVSMGSFIFRDEYGIGPSGFSLIFAANSIGIIVGSQISVRFVERFGPARMLQTGLILRFVGALIVTVALVSGAELVFVLLPLLLVEVASGMQMGNQMGLGLTPYGKAAGAAAALLGFAIFLFGSFIPPLVSSGSTSGWAMGVTMATASLIALVLWFMVIRPKVEAYATVQADEEVVPSVVESVMAGTSQSSTKEQA